VESYFIEKKFAYDGSQLHSLFGYLEHGVQGPSIVSWIGPCNISNEHMVDGEDLLAKALIQGDEMLHFIIELFDRDLFAGVSVQRLFASIAKDYIESKSPKILAQKKLHRDGDDIYLGEQKLSISIATRSPVSTLVHFAMNVTNRGTPVKTLSFEDLELDPVRVAEDLMNSFRKEFTSMLTATQKVRPVP
jgi:hypothetical protein